MPNGSTSVFLAHNFSIYSLNTHKSHTLTSCSKSLKSNLCHDRRTNPIPGSNGTATRHIQSVNAIMTEESCDDGIGITFAAEDERHKHNDKTQQDMKPKPLLSRFCTIQQMEKQLGSLIRIILESDSHSHRIT